MKKFAYYLSFCAFAVGMILLRPFCAGAVNNYSSNKPFHSFNAIQRVIKKNDSHEDASELTENRQSAKTKVILPPFIHPYYFLLTGNVVVSSLLSSIGHPAIHSFLGTYFQVTSRLRV
jgi:hypothetical protein